MPGLNRLSTKGQLILGFSVVLLLTAGIIGLDGLSALRAANVERVEAANKVGVEVLAEVLNGSNPGLQAQFSADGALGRVTWADMPETLPDDMVDPIGRITGLAITIFRWVPDSGEFVREATTIQLGDGARAVGTELARGAVYDAMIAGRTYHGEADILGLPYVTYYHPVMDADGRPMGIFFAGFETAAIDAAFAASALEMGAIALVVLILGLTAIWFLVRQRMAPLALCERAVVAWSRDDLDHAVPTTDRKDEFGRMQSSLVTLHQAMRDAREASEARARLETEQAAVVEALSSALARLAQLDLTATISGTRTGDFPEGYELLTNSFDSLVAALRGTISTIRELVVTMEDSAGHMNSAAGNLAHRAESQASTLAQSAAALEQLSASVKSAARNATEAEEAMSRSQVAAGEAGGVVGDAVEAMKRIETSSEHITRIIGVIDDIAFQTNLLALNAGVEAARAGEGGRGFAVVAAEVRALAQRSSESAKEISDLISASSKEVKVGSGLVTKAGAALEQIKGQIDEVTNKVKDMAQSAREQSHAISEINAGVRDLDDVTQQNAAMAEEASATSEELSDATRSISARIDAFRLADGTDDLATAA